MFQQLKVVSVAALHWQYVHLRTDKEYAFNPDNKINTAVWIYAKIYTNIMCKQAYL